MAGAVCPISPSEADWRTPAAAKFLVKGSAASINGCMNGHANGFPETGSASHMANGTHPANGSHMANGCHVANGVGPHADSDDEEFHPPEPSRIGSSSTDDFFDAAEDGLEEYMSSDEDFHNASSISGSGRSTPTRGRRTSYRDLVARIQEESRRRAAAEEALTACTKRLKGVEAAVTEATNTLHRSSLLLPSSAGSDDAVGEADVASANNGESQNEDTRARSSDQSQDASGEPDVAIAEADAAGSDSVESALARAIAAAIQRGEEHKLSDTEHADLLARREAEVSRLRDKLQYWERMNQEMVQKNNEAIEHMRAHRRRWNIIWKVMGVGAAVTVGAGVMLAVSHLSSSSSGASSDYSHGSSSGSSTDGCVSSSSGTAATE